MSSSCWHVGVSKLTINGLHRTCVILITTGASQCAADLSVHRCHVYPGMRCYIAGIVLLLTAGCASMSARTQSGHPTTQPAGRIDAGMQAPTAGAVAVALQSRREVGSSSTSGSHSPTFTVVNSPWPVVAFGLGCGLLLTLWQRERSNHRRTRKELVRVRLAVGPSPVQSDSTSNMC